jgi:hypothetical protein
VCSGSYEHVLSSLGRDDGLLRHRDTAAAIADVVSAIRLDGLYMMTGRLGDSNDSSTGDAGLLLLPRFPCRRLDHV